MRQLQFDPHEPQQRLPHISKDSDMEDWLASFNAGLPAMALPEVAAQPDLPFVYIVGVPRSGTTLLSQVLSHCLDLGYINNLIAKFWERPSIGVRLSKAVLGADPGRTLGFSSHYGTTEGAAGPHEFGYFWRKWLPLDSAPTHHLSGEQLSAVDSDGLRDALERELLGAFGKPLVTKNVICGFNAAFLTSLHAPSLFIFIDRDPYVAACSILEARRQRFGSHDAWWSLKPSIWPFKAKDAGEEVGLQVLHCRREMLEELQRPGVRYLHVSYEELCAGPQQVLDAVRDALADMGADVAQLRSLAQVFTPTPAPAIPQALDESLRRVLSTHSAE